MAKFVVPAVTGVLDARAAQIAGDLGNAAKQRVEAEAILAEYSAKLAQAKKEAAEIITKARADAEAMANDRLRQMDTEMARKTEDARKAIEAAKDAALSSVQSDITALTLAATEKLLGTTVDAKVAAKVTDEILAKGIH
jgi:F-type H+-transporting ATPase subunit b